MEAPTSPFYQSAEATRDSTQWSRLDNFDCDDVSVHPHGARQGLPWPSPATIAPTVESHYPLVGGDGGGGSYPPILPLEPWHANDHQGDMEWQQEDEDYQYSQADVGAPSQALLTPRSADSSGDGFSRGRSTSSASAQVHDIGDDHRGRVNLGDFIIPHGAGLQGPATDRGGARTPRHGVGILCQ